ncbi:hypothetical protein CCHOA_02855 [Corynebacterium choanae]|uniref:Uncharacterized protein n=1 Tax=Corynebacterium choanae TaxID=1862358 RepID=A0A3G6J4N3_9CORY|nr:hypothetical protein CCHOA_02855 [Corynebacterium choanae]
MNPNRQGHQAFRRIQHYVGVLSSQVKAATNLASAVDSVVRLARAMRWFHGTFHNCVLVHLTGVLKCYKTGVVKVILVVWRGVLFAACRIGDPKMQDSPCARASQMRCKYLQPYAAPGDYGNCQ